MTVLHVELQRSVERVKGLGKQGEKRQAETSELESVS